MWHDGKVKITVWMTPDEREAIRRLAAEHGCNLSQWVRWAALLEDVDDGEAD